MPADNIVDFKIKALEEKVQACATQDHLEQMEDRLTSELKHLRQLFKYFAVAVLLVLSGTSVINSDAIVKILGV